MHPVGTFLTQKGLFFKLQINKGRLILISPSLYFCFKKYCKYKKKSNILIYIQTVYFTDVTLVSDDDSREHMCFISLTAYANLKKLFKTGNFLTYWIWNVPQLFSRYESLSYLKYNYNFLQTRGIKRISSLVNLYTVRRFRAGKPHSATRSLHGNYTALSVRLLIHNLSQTSHFFNKKEIHCFYKKLFCKKHKPQCLKKRF